MSLDKENLLWYTYHAKKVKDCDEEWLFSFCRFRESAAV